MVTSTERSPQPQSAQPLVFSLEDFMSHPPERMEWVDGQLIEKKAMTLRHSQIQSRLDYYWQSTTQMLTPARD